MERSFLGELKLENSCRFLLFKVDEMQYAVSMEYVAYIVSATEPFPSCRLPDQNSYVESVINIGQQLITIIELSVLKNSIPLYRSECQRPLILVLDYSNSLVGLMADYIDSPLENSELKIERDEFDHQNFLIYDKQNFILFDVPEFYKKLCDL